MTSSQIFSVWPSHLVNKYIFFLLELMENCIFETDPVKKNALSHCTLSKLSSKQTQKKICSMLWCQPWCNSSYFGKSLQFLQQWMQPLVSEKKDMSNTTSKLIATVEIKLHYIKQPKPPSFKPFETKLNPWFVLLCTFDDNGVLGPPKT